LEFFLFLHLPLLTLRVYMHLDGGRQPIVGVKLECGAPIGFTLHYWCESRHWRVYQRRRRRVASMWFEQSM